MRSLSTTETRHATQAPVRCSANVRIEKTGVVAHWKDDKHYGFIRPDDGGEDVFVHRSGVEDDPGVTRDLARGDRVAFRVTIGDRGPKAVDVRRVA